MAGKNTVADYSIHLSPANLGIRTAQVAAAKKFNSKAPSPVTGAYLLHDKKGLQYKKNALDTAWRRVMDEALDSGLEQGFTFHDLKAKGISDHQHKHGGHRSGKMKRVYDRLPDLVKATK